MPIQLARKLLGQHRTPEANRTLGLLLAFVAGAINAGGFLAVQQYTSHVTGMVSSMADNLVLGKLDWVVDSAVAVVSFVMGAMTCAILVGYGRRRQLASLYALPLLLEAALILTFGFVGSRMTHLEALFVPSTVILLCFMMGLQNAVVTKLSNAVIRTTHMTGVVTDLGIELGKLVYWNNANSLEPRVEADRQRIKILGGLLLSFLSGGIVGAFGFKTVGYVFTLPIAAVLAGFALVPFVDDLLERKFHP